MESIRSNNFLDHCCIIRDKLLAPSPPNFNFLVCLEG